MRPRTELVAGAALLAVLVLVAAILGRARRPADLGDRRLSTYLTGPDGARGLADALGRLGTETPRWRGRVRQLVEALQNRPEPRALALLDPGQGLEPTEIALLARWHAEPAAGDLVLVGPGAAGLMECFGWDTGDLAVRPHPVAPPGQSPDSAAARATVFLEEDFSAFGEDRPDRLCEPPPVARVDTLLVSDDGRLAALRLVRDDNGRAVTLVGDPDLFRNRALRESSTGPDVLAMVAGRYRSVTFLESVHGFGQQGSLWGAVFAWSARSPWGWAAWQLAIVGLLALFASAVRFGPVRRVIERRRRSPLEHVEALAAALSAARGHDVAVRAMVRGLRRRLVPGRAPGGDPVPWLEDLSSRLPEGRPRAAAGALLTLTAPGQPASAVLAAGQTVEDLWEELHPA